MKPTATGLVRYEAARRALIEATRVDEVKAILDQAAALKEYARRAKDGELIAKAVELKEHAERRVGEMIAEQKRTVGLARGGRRSRVSEKPAKPTLAEAGVDKNLADRARKAAALPADKFKARVEERVGLARAIAEGDKAIVKAARARRQADKRATRQAREAKLADKILKLPEKRYGVILADPPWRFSTWSEAGKDRSAENHYPTAALDAIKRLDVRSIAAKDSTLWLWSTAPMLEAALSVMYAWGFRYVGRVVWAKDRIGTGYWFRDQAEELLLGIRGNVPAPAPGGQWTSLQPGPVRRHSQKPDWQYVLIEAYFPDLPKVELYARRARKGWDRWGLEAPIAEAAE